MSWPIKFLEQPPLHHYDGTVDFSKLEIGDVCYYHYQGKPCTERSHLDQLHLTKHYFSNNAGRPPLILALPDAATPNGKQYFMVDGQGYSNKCTKCGKSSYKNTCGEGLCTPKGLYDCWTVSGIPPNITVVPSVNYDNDDPPTKHYHGFVNNGVIGDPV